MQRQPFTSYALASVRALVSHSSAAALSRTYVKRAVHANDASEDMSERTADNREEGAKVFAT
eukprot:806209-Prymnesium_polylepis.1